MDSFFNNIIKNEITVLSLPKTTLTRFLLPITLFMLLCGIVTTYLRMPATSRKTASTKSPTLLKHQSILNYSKNFQTNGHLLTPQHFHIIKNNLLLNNELRPETIKYREAQFERENRDVDLYEFFMSSFGSFFETIPSIIQFTIVSYLFNEGIIIAQLPITFLPNNWKPMFHYGITKSISSLLNVNYISSMSWYVLNSVGLSSLRGLFLTSNRKTETWQNVDLIDYTTFHHIDKSAFFPSIQANTNSMILPTTQDPFQGALPIGISPTFKEDITKQQKAIKKIEHPSIQLITNTTNSIQKDYIVQSEKRLINTSRSI